MDEKVRPTKLEALNAAFRCLYLECPEQVVNDVKRRFDEYLAEQLASAPPAPAILPACNECFSTRVVHKNDCSFYSADDERIERAMVEEAAPASERELRELVQRIRNDELYASEVADDLERILSHEGQPSAAQGTSAQCNHLQLKRQKVGEYSYFKCVVCPQKFKVDLWDGKVRVLTQDAAQERETAVTGETSDGYHTFNELYEHRHALFAAVVSAYGGWKSKLHDDGTMFDGWFIAGVPTHKGYATYHMPLSIYDAFPGKELERAPKWDGHTPSEAAERIASLSFQAAPLEASDRERAAGAEKYLRETFPFQEPTGDEVNSLFDLLEAENVLGYKRGQEEMRERAAQSIDCFIANAFWSTGIVMSQRTIRALPVSEKE